MSFGYYGSLLLLFKIGFEERQGAREITTNNLFRIDMQFISVNEMKNFAFDITVQEFAEREWKFGISDENFPYDISRINFPSFRLSASASASSDVATIPKHARGWKCRLVERKRFMPKKLIFTVFIYFLMCATKMFIFNFVMCSGSYRVHELSASNNWKRCCCCRMLVKRKPNIDTRLSAKPCLQFIGFERSPPMYVTWFLPFKIRNYEHKDWFFLWLNKTSSLMSRNLLFLLANERVRLFGFYFKICMKRHHKKWDEKKAWRKMEKISAVLLSNIVFLHNLNVVFSSSSSSAKAVTRIEPTDSKTEWTF